MTLASRIGPADAQRIEKVSTPAVADLQSIPIRFQVQCLDATTGCSGEVVMDQEVCRIIGPVLVFAEAFTVDDVHLMR